MKHIQSLDPFWIFISSSLPQLPWIYFTSNAFIARGIDATQVDGRKVVIGVACGRGLSLATTLEIATLVRNECKKSSKRNTKFESGLCKENDSLSSRSTSNTAKDKSGALWWGGINESSDLS
jgi:hypothetical protein